MNLLEAKWHFKATLISESRSAKSRFAKSCFIFNLRPMIYAQQFTRKDLSATIDWEHFAEKSRFAEESIFAEESHLQRNLALRRNLVSGMIYMRRCMSDFHVTIYVRRFVRREIPLCRWVWCAQCPCFLNESVRGQMTLILESRFAESRFAESGFAESGFAESHDDVKMYDECQFCHFYW